VPVRVSASRSSSEAPYVVVGELKKIAGREVVVFDLDGVLVDNTERYRLSLADVDPSAQSHEDLPRDKRSQFWRIFLSDRYIEYDRPIHKAIEMLNRRREKGYPIVIVTGRTDNMMNATLEQLKAFGIEYDALIMRRTGIYIKDYDFKGRTVDSLNLQIYEIHDDSADVIAALHHYASRGSFYWYKPGKYVYAPPVVLFVNGNRHVIDGSENTLRAMLRSIEASPADTVEIRYGDYRIVLPKQHAKMFIEVLFFRLHSELCYPECFYIEDGITFFEVIQLAAEDAEKGEMEKTKIFGETHPSCTNLDFDKIFANHKRIVEAWLELKESGIISEVF